jgi:DNA repair protein RadD
MLFVQMVGRGLRTAEGKPDCLILDHSDNHVRLGFVTDIHHDELDKGDKKLAPRRLREEPLPKKCIKCTFLKPPKMLRCPCCGYSPAPAPKAVHVDGELIELTSRSTGKPPTIAEQMVFYSELKRIQETREYKSGWTAHKFRERFGHFPPFAWNNQPSLAPSPATFRWVQSRTIAWAKSRARAS